jgi:hypothetical protein
MRGLGKERKPGSVTIRFWRMNILAWARAARSHAARRALAPMVPVTHREV